MAGEGPAVSVPALERAVDRGWDSGRSRGLPEFRGEIMDHWRPGVAHAGDDRSYGSRLLKVLQVIGNVELVEQYIRQVLPRYVDGSEGKALCRLCERFGWERLGGALREFIAQQSRAATPSRFGPWFRFAKASAAIRPRSPKSAVRCAILSPRSCSRSSRPGMQWIPNGRFMHREKQTGMVASMVHLLGRLAAKALLDSFISHVLSNRQLYGLHEVLIPEVKAIHQWVPDVPAAQGAASRLLEHCLAELRAATPKPGTALRRSRNGDLRCHCEDCTTLSQFLRDPVQQTARFAVREARRKHLEAQIGLHNCDVTCVTERTGSPHALVCTKTRATYERQLKQYQADQAFVAQLAQLAPPKRSSNQGKQKR